MFTDCRYGDRDANCSSIATYECYETEIEDFTCCDTCSIYNQDSDYGYGGCSYIFGLFWFLFNNLVNNFQSFWNGASASWVFTKTWRTLKCLGQGNYTAVVGFEHWTSSSRARSSTTELPCPCSYCSQSGQRLYCSPLR